MPRGIWPASDVRAGSVKKLVGVGPTWLPDRSSNDEIMSRNELPNMFLSPNNAHITIFLKEYVLGVQKCQSHTGTKSAQSAHHTRTCNP